MSTIDAITTAQQLADAHGLGRCELVRGELVMMSPSGFEHGRIVMRIAGPLDAYVTRHRLGVVTGAETGFHIEEDPDTVRAPDVGFVQTARIPPESVTGFFPGPPDLAVEVLSPSDRASQMLQKVQEWLKGGCGVVWVVDPASRTVTVYRNNKEANVFDHSDTLSDDIILAKFSLKLSDIFKR